jgi:tetratricopeptide (TPR) repeat protein
MAGKWLSAYRVLDDFDKADADPYALAMKTSLVLTGAVRSDKHISFGLVDLEDGQTLETLRSSEGDYEKLPLDPPALAAAQAAHGVVAPGVLSKELGDYYFDVLARYSGQWSINDNEILTKIVENYAAAYSAGIYDSKSLLNHAESLVRLGRGDESDPVYQKAEDIDPKNPAIQYSYASSLAYRGKKAQALPEVDKAIVSYGSEAGLINAIALGARLASELGDDAKVESYFALADKDYPDSPNPGILRHLVSVDAGKKEAAAAAADSLAAKYGSNPNVVRAVVTNWFSAGDVADARDFLQRNIAKGGDDMTLGTLNFYLAVLLVQNTPSEDDRKVALKALDDAEAHFKTSLGQENEVYGVIAGIRKSLQPQSASPAPEATGNDRPQPPTPASGAAGN